MAVSDFILTVTHPTTGIETVLNYVNDDLIFNKSDEDEFVVKRNKLETTLIFKNADYDYLKALEGICDKVYAEISYDTTVVFTGYFSMRSGTWRASRKHVELKLNLEGDDTCFKDKQKETVNLLLNSPRNSVKVYNGEIRRTTPLTTRSFTVPGGILELRDQDLLADYAPKDDILTGYIPGVWKLIEYRMTGIVDNGNGTYTGDVIARWAALEVSAGVFEPLEFYYNTSASSPNYTEGFYSLFWNITGAENNADPRIPNGITMQSALERFAGLCFLNVKSDFFNINPDGTAPNNFAYQQAALYANNIMIFQKSDVKRPDAGEAATRMEASLEDFRTTLDAVFRVQLFVENGFLRAEHISYLKGLAVDPFDITVYPEAAGLDEYEYNVDDNFRYIEFKSRENEGNFSAPQFTFPEGCSNGNKKTYQSKLADFDVMDILANAGNDKYADEGMVFVSVVFNGTEFAIARRDSGTITNAFNGSMSWLNLSNDYHRYELPSSDFEQGFIARTAETVKATRKLNSIGIYKYPVSDWVALDADRTLLVTSVGNCIIDNVQWSAKTATVTFNALF